MSYNTIGVMTSGGDAPGMNAAIRAVVRTAKYYDMRVVGIRKGYSGLLHGDLFDMTARDVSDILHRGGTILQTARCPEFREERIVKRGIERAKYFDIEAMVVIGGDGSFNGGASLAKQGMPVVCVPATIDNDIAYTDYTIGFDTAVNTAKDCVDKIRDTATSHERCYIVEVMGRHSGAIALHVGISTGAEHILIPEREFDFDKDIIGNINAGKKRGKKHFVFIIAEGVDANANELAGRIQERTGLSTRASNLGYIQRGGSPTSTDRLLASQLGNRAVELVRKGMQNRAVGVNCGEMFDMDLSEALAMEKKCNDEMASLAEILAI